VPQDSLQSIVPDLATGWSWNEDGTELTFPLREGVAWHDDKPFTARDVQCTFDMLTGKSSDKLRVNPRKSWYQNLDRVTAGRFPGHNGNPLASHPATILPSNRRNSRHTVSPAVLDTGNFAFRWMSLVGQEERFPPISLLLGGGVLASARNQWRRCSYSGRPSSSQIV
jgi:hypothetical protein